jgi:hypothetical protein
LAGKRANEIARIISDFKWMPVINLGIECPIVKQNIRNNGIRG